MSQDQLYNDAIIATARANHRAGRLATPDSSATCDNPLCGDRVTIDLALADGAIADLAQKTRGCLLTQAAASVLASRAQGLTGGAVQQARQAIARVLAGEPPDAAWPELAMFAPVGAVRSRHECVLLPFDALAEAYRHKG